MLFLKDKVKKINRAVLRLMRKMLKILDPEPLKDLVCEVMAAMLECPLKNELIVQIRFIVLVLIKKVGKDTLKSPHVV